MNIPSKRRESNIELLRIVAMFLIVAHHYVVNSGVGELMNVETDMAKTVWMQLFGMWGKTAINSFVLITGYFMCTSRLTARRFLKVFLEMVFYAWVMWAILLAADYETMSFTRIAKLFLWPIRNINRGFGTSFIWMYLFIPFMNRLIEACDRRTLYRLVGLQLVMFTLAGTFFFAPVFHHVFWYMTLYFVGALIRLHPMKWMNDNRWCVALLCSCVAAAVMSVVGIGWIQHIRNHAPTLPSLYYFVSDSHKLLAFLIGGSSFLVFKNLKIGYSRFVNTVASTTFGILLIHAASDAMRQWLWKDFVDVSGHFLSLSLGALVAFSIGVCTSVFAVCSVLDWLRIRLIERPLFNRRPFANIMMYV